MKEILKNLRQSIENRRSAMRRGLLKDADRQNKIITMQSCRAIDQVMKSTKSEKEMGELLTILKPKEYNLFSKSKVSSNEAISELSKIRKDLKCG